MPGSLFSGHFSLDSLRLGTGRSPQERPAEVNKINEVSHQITVRYQPLFADPRSVTRMRVLFKGRVFAIHGALNEDEANVAVILLASEGVRDG